MIPKHTRTGIAHNLTYLRLHFRLVAVDRTDLASRLLLSELAMVQTLTGIVKQGRTLFAKPFAARVLFPITVDLYHLPYCFLLLLYPFHSLAKDTNFFIFRNACDGEKRDAACCKQGELPPRVEYSLTELGKSAMPRIEALFNWAKEHFDEITSPSR